MRVLTVLSFRVRNDPLPVLIAEAMEAISSTNVQLTFACANPHSLSTACRDRELAAAFHATEQLVADGVGLTVFARLLGLGKFERITGSDYFTALMSALNERGRARVFFLGSTDNVLARIVQRTLTQYPNIEICGVLAPPFGEWSPKDKVVVLDAIAAARPDVVWVGMTAPRQEKWVDEHRSRIDCKILASIGAVFDFYAGTKPRAPRWMTGTGLEWLHRLVLEPKRMWKRIFISTPRFAYLLVRQRLGLAQECQS